MKKLYPKHVFLVTAALFFGVFMPVFAQKITPRADTVRANSKAATKITDTRKEKPAFLKSNIKVNLVPFKPSAIKVTTTSKPIAVGDGKLLSNVKVYPNPISEQVNVNYSLSKETHMTIKIMDFLGNEVATLLSRKLAAGEQNASFSINSELNRGLYFIRFIAGNETVIKRISIQ